MERGVRATLIVPVRETSELLAERVRTKWHQNYAHAFVLERQDESLDERNTPVLADGAKARCDPVVVTPIFEQVAPELLALQGKGVTLRPLPPLRTVHDSFPSHGSSLSKARYRTQ